MAEGIRKKGSRLHHVCHSGQKLGAALPVCLPWEPCVVGTFCFLMDEAVCVCVCVCFIYPHEQPCDCHLPTSPKRGPNFLARHTRGTSKELNPQTPLFQSPHSGTKIKSPQPDLGC